MKKLSKSCAEEKHNWCMNRSLEETSCECDCHKIPIRYIYLFSVYGKVLYASFSLKTVQDFAKEYLWRQKLILNPENDIKFPEDAGLIYIHSTWSNHKDELCALGHEILKVEVK